MAAAPGSGISVAVFFFFLVCTVFFLLQHFNSSLMFELRLSLIRTFFPPVTTMTSAKAAAARRITQAGGLAFGLLANKDLCNHHLLNVFLSSGGIKQPDLIADP